MNSAQWKIESPIGPLYLVATHQGLKGVFWRKQSVPMAKTLDREVDVIKFLTQAQDELCEYFKGQRKTFQVPLDIDGTPFQKKVWSQLRKIPYGKTSSYKDVAQNIKNEKAVRAVGAANGKNPLCIIVPCHRVISADGTLGGYSGGLPKKTLLLELEARFA